MSGVNLVTEDSGQKPLESSALFLEETETKSFPKSNSLKTSVIVTVSSEGKKKGEEEEAARVYLE